MPRTPRDMGNERIMRTFFDDMELPKIDDLNTTSTSAMRDKINEILAALREAGLMEN